MLSVCKKSLRGKAMSRIWNQYRTEICSLKRVRSLPNLTLLVMSELAFTPSSRRTRIESLSLKLVSRDVSGRMRTVWRQANFRLPQNWYNDEIKGTGIDYCWDFWDHETNLWISFISPKMWGLGPAPTNLHMLVHLEKKIWSLLTTCHWCNAHLRRLFPWHYLPSVSCLEWKWV